MKYQRSRGLERPGVASRPLAGPRWTSGPVLGLTLRSMSAGRAYCRWVSRLDSKSESPQDLSAGVDVSIMEACRDATPALSTSPDWPCGPEGRHLTREVPRAGLGAASPAAPVAEFAAFHCPGHTWTWARGHSPHASSCICPGQGQPQQSEASGQARWPVQSGQ